MAAPRQSSAGSRGVFRILITHPPFGNVQGLLESLFVPKLPTPLSCLRLLLVVSSHVLWDTKSHASLGWPSVSWASDAPPRTRDPGQIHPANVLDVALLVLSSFETLDGMGTLAFGELVSLPPWHQWASEPCPPGLVGVVLPRTSPCGPAARGSGSQGFAFGSRYTDCFKQKSLRWHPTQAGTLEGPTWCLLG